jgi:signal transduction histidine kinase
MIETAKQKFKDKIPPIFLALFFVSILLVGWFFVRVINSSKEKILSDMEIEMARLERSFTEKVYHTFYMMNNIILQISANPKDKKYIHKILSQYRNNQQLAGAFSWTIFSWSDADYQIIVDSKYGIMKEPVDLSARDYIAFTESDPGHLQLGTPVIGSTSKKWMIPAAIGLADKNGNYLGALTLGFEIPVMAQLLYKVLENPDVNFALFSKSGNAVLEGDFKSSGPITVDERSVINHDAERIVNKINLGPKKKIYDVSIITNRHAFLAKKIDNYPYIFILNYDRTSIAKELLYVTFSRLSEIFSIIFALTVLLVLIHRERTQALNTFYLKKIAEQANATKTEFLIKTTHEFKNFVFGINGCAEIIKNDLRRLIESLRHENHEKDKGHISGLEVDLDMSHHIIESSDNIDGFLSHLLQVNDAKDTNFTVRRSFHPVNIAQIIDLSITALKKRSKEAETILVKKVSKDLYKISNVDPRRIKQIITSVIARAIKNSHIGDVVQIYANNITDEKILENIYNVYGLKKSQAVEIIIRDNGMSNNENEMMYMMRSALNRKKSNNLKIKIPALKYLVEKQGGIFEVNSTQNQGNEIKIIL